MVQNQNLKDQTNLQPGALTTWRLNRVAAEKREESVHREIMRRQFTH